MLISVELWVGRFGYKQNLKGLIKVNSDIKKIRRRWREEKGYIQALKLTDKRVLKAFYMYDMFVIGEITYANTLKFWDDFVDVCLSNKECELPQVGIYWWKRKRELIN